MLVAELWLLGVFSLFQLAVPLGGAGADKVPAVNPKITLGRSGVKARLVPTTEATAAAGGAKHFGPGLMI